MQRQQHLPRTADCGVTLGAMLTELKSSRVGITGGHPEVTNQFSSYIGSKNDVLADIDNGYILRLPYAGTTVKFEMFFNLNNPLLRPDFICLSDEDFYPDVDAEMPSLARWGETRHNIPLAQQLAIVISELVTAFRRYQHTKLRYVFPNLRQECLGDVGDDVEVCLEQSPNNTAEKSKATWCLHALIKLPSLPPKTYSLLSNQQHAKDAIYLYWGMTLPSNSNGTGPCSSRPSGTRAEVSLLRNDTIRDFFNEFGFKNPSIDPSDTFTSTSTRYVEAFNSFLVKTPQALERRRQVLESFGERLHIVHVDKRRYSSAYYLVTVGTSGSCLLSVSFSSLQSNSLPTVELVSAYPIPRLPGASRKTFAVKLSNMPTNFEQVKPIEFVEKVHIYLGHVAPPFISETSNN